MILPVYGGNPMLMTRNLLYTAITRAKKAAVIVGEQYTVKRMVDNDFIALRYSMLGAFIQEAQARDRLLFGEKNEAQHKTAPATD